jgi:YfiH family protein
MIALHCKRDISEGIDGSPESVVTRLKNLLPDSRIYCLNQVHEEHIVFAEDIHCGDIPEADGIISRNLDDVLCIRTADCVPVLLWMDDPPLIAAVHAGWRGLAKNIVEKVVQNMHALGAGEIHVSIGPCIGVCCYEVGPDVVNELGTETLVYKKKSMHIDLKNVVLSQVLEAGVGRELVHVVDICTSCNPKEFFSYRRDGHAAGRNLSIIGGKSWLLPGLQVG